jgi:hypothetical protein
MQLTLLGYKYWKKFTDKYWGFDLLINKPNHKRCLGLKKKGQV